MSARQTTDFALSYAPIMMGHLNAAAILGTHSVLMEPHAWVSDQTLIF